jgi:hypothetical protein
MGSFETTISPQGSRKPSVLCFVEGYIGNGTEWPLYPMATRASDRCRLTPWAPIASHQREKKAAR